MPREAALPRRSGATSEFPNTSGGSSGRAGPYPGYTAADSGESDLQRRPLWGEHAGAEAPPESALRFAKTDSAATAPGDSHVARFVCHGCPILAIRSTQVDAAPCFFLRGGGYLLLLTLYDVVDLDIFDRSDMPDTSTVEIRSASIRRGGLFRLGASMGGVFRATTFAMEAYELLEEGSSQTDLVPSQSPRRSRSALP